MKYYEIHCSTPYYLEDNYYYFKTDEEEKVKDYAQECLYENGNKWYDEQAKKDYPKWEDYVADCDYRVRKITKEEYEDECPWDKEE
jgi:hypothetical protein